jgi:hypothetical protein
MNTLEPLKLVSLSYDNIIFRKTKNIKNKEIIFLKYKNNFKESNFVIQLSKLINTNIIEKNIMELKVTNEDDIKYLNELDNFIIHHLRNNTIPINYNRILSNKNILKIKLFNNNEFKTQILLNDEAIDDFSSILSPNSTSKIILEIFAICIKTDSVCLLLRPINIAIKYGKCNFYNYKFIKDSDSESECEYNGETEYENNEEIELTNNLFIKSKSIINNEKNKSESEDKSESESKLVSELKSDLESEAETETTSITSSDK